MEKSYQVNCIYITKLLYWEENCAVLGCYAARSGGFLTLEDGTDSVSQNIGKELPVVALSPSHTCLWPPCGLLPSTACFCTWTRPYPVTLLPNGSGYFRANPFPCINTPTCPNLDILHSYPPMKKEQNVLKCRHTKFRCRWITQKKAYNIHNVAKVWNQELPLAV
jgi:hypothetical protein